MFRLGVFLLFTLSFMANTSGQVLKIGKNLIPNPSFELTSGCQFLHTTPEEPIKTREWFSPSGATPDLFNRCALGEMGVPTNYVGRVAPVEGDNYIGLFYGAPKNKNESANYREYLMCSLLEVLQEDSVYHYQFFVKAAEYANWQHQYLSFAFSSEKLQFTHDSIISIENKILVDTDTLPQEGGWMKVSGRYKANGTEAYLLIGDLLPNEENEYNPVTDRAYSTAKRVSAYYLFDDFLLHLPVLEDARFPIEEAFTVDSLFFAFNSDELSTEQYQQLIPLIRHMEANDNLQLTIIGNTDETGTEAYNLELSKRRAMVVKEYLLLMGIADYRLQIVGKGETDLISEKDELNRRTVFILKEF